MHRQLLLVAVALLCQQLYPPVRSEAQEKPVYLGKTVRIINTAQPGSPPDVASRLYARHLPRFIPGNPRTIVQNMPGGGGLVGANYLYNVAKADGLTVGVVEPPFTVTQLAGVPGVKFDYRAFGFIGAIEDATQLAVLRGDLPYDTIDKARKAKDPIVATTRRVGSVDYIGAKAIEALGVPIKVLTGFFSSPEQMAALERREADLFVASTIAIKSLRPAWLHPYPKGPVHHLAIFGPERVDLAHVPNIVDFTPVPGNEGFVEIADFLSRKLRSRVLAAPPGIPNATLDILRESFRRMVKDEAFAAEAERVGITLRPLQGQELQKEIREFMANPVVREVAPKLVEK